MGQEKDNSNRTQNDKIIMSDSALFSDAISYCLQKGQKLSSAVHLVTEHLSDTEPLRTFIRSKSISILSLILSARSAASVSFSAPMISSAIEELLSLVSIAEGARFVNAANAAILRAEYKGLLDIAQRVRKTDQHILNPSSLAVDLTFEPRLLDKNRSTAAKISSNSVALVLKESTESHVRTDPALRRKAILDFVSKATKVSVRDLAAVIGDVSEKTLQRELVALVTEGVLKKEGDRRWSTYSLAGLPAAL